MVDTCQTPPTPIYMYKHIISLILRVNYRKIEREGEGLERENKKGEEDGETMKIHHSKV